jgi:hypothetical protein
MSENRQLVALGEGVYTVPEAARILRPNMTEDRLRYWLNEGLLGEPVRRGYRTCCPSSSYCRPGPYGICEASSGSPYKK